MNESLRFSINHYGARGHSSLSPIRSDELTGAFICVRTPPPSGEADPSRSRFIDELLEKYRLFSKRGGSAEVAVIQPRTPAEPLERAA